MDIVDSVVTLAKSSSFTFIYCFRDRYWNWRTKLCLILFR